jgi:uncharacterized protein
MSETLYEAAVYGDEEAVRKILADDPEAVREVDEFGFTALHGVAGEHHFGIAQLLIDHGADVNAANDEGITPLHLAAWPEMVEVLARNGAEVNARAREGDTPLPIQAAEPESEAVMEALLRSGADVNARNRSGATALEIAKDREEPEKVALLTRHGARDTT